MINPLSMRSQYYLSTDQMQREFCMARSFGSHPVCMMPNTGLELILKKLFISDSIYLWAPSRIVLVINLIDKKSVLSRLNSGSQLCGSLDFCLVWVTSEVPVTTDLGFFLHSSSCIVSISDSLFNKQKPS